MPTYIDPKFVHVEPRGKGGAVAVVVTAGLVFAVVEIVTSAAFSVAVDVAVGVVSALCIAGVALAVRELRHPSWGPLWRPAVRKAASAGAQVVRKAPVPALPVAMRRAIEGPAAIHYHLHVDGVPDGELVRALRRVQPALEEDQ